MAGCDNLYGNKKQWDELFKFFYENKPKHLQWMKPRPISGKQRVCYIPPIQKWLKKHCDLKWVQKELDGKFMIQAMICGKPHHERKRDVR